MSVRRLPRLGDPTLEIEVTENEQECQLHDGDWTSRPNGDPLCIFPTRPGVWEDEWDSANRRYEAYLMRVKVGVQL